MDFISKELDTYCNNHTSPECEVLRELNHETHTSVLNPRMLSGNLQGQFLTMISRMVRAKCILEIGTYTGYSAICLAKGLPADGVLHTIDVNEELEDIAQKYFKKAKLEHQIVQHIGDATEIIPNLNLKLDLVFIDADKKTIQLTLTSLLTSLILAGGLLLIMFSGRERL